MSEPEDVDALATEICFAAEEWVSAVCVANLILSLKERIERLEQATNPQHKAKA